MDANDEQAKVDQSPNDAPIVISRKQLVRFGAIAAAVAVVLVFSWVGFGLAKNYYLFNVKRIPGNDITSASYIGSIRMSDEDKELLMRAVMRSAGAGLFGIEPINVSGKSVSQVVKEQRAYEKQVKEAEEARSRAEADARERYQKALAAARAKVDVLLLDFTHIHKDSDNWVFSNGIAITLEIRNNTDKTLRGVQGTTRFKDIFGNVLRETQLSYDEAPIKPRGKASYYGSMDLNEYIEADNTFFSKKLEDLVFEFDPEQLIYTDGEKVEIAKPDIAEPSLF